MKVFLGGTCNESQWRQQVIANLTIDYFNPVVDDWTQECMAEEVRQRQSCDLVLYVITPLMTGTYAIAEVIDDSNKRPERTVFCFLENDVNAESKQFRFTGGQVRSLTQVGKMVERNGAKVCGSLEQVWKHLNGVIFQT